MGKNPSEAFFKTVKAAFPLLPFIAEDLADIDGPIRDTINRLGIPGMRVLLFAFNDDPKNPHLPKKHVKNANAFTGTHDTNTVKGWFTDDASGKERKNLFKLVGKKYQLNKLVLKLSS